MVILVWVVLLVGLTMIAKQVGDDYQGGFRLEGTETAMSINEDGVIAIASLTPSTGNIVVHRLREQP